MKSTARTAPKSILKISRKGKISLPHVMFPLLRGQKSLIIPPVSLWKRMLHCSFTGKLLSSSSETVRHPSSQSCFQNVPWETQGLKSCIFYKGVDLFFLIYLHDTLYLCVKEQGFFFTVLSQSSGIGILPRLWAISADSEHFLNRSRSHSRSQQQGTLPHVLDEDHKKLYVL